MNDIFTLRAQINIRARDTDEAFAKLAEHFGRLAASKDPDETVFCGGMLALDPAEAVPTGALVPSDLMRLIVKCKGNFQLLPQHERFKARGLLAHWERHEKMMAPPNEETSDGNSKESAAAPVQQPVGKDQG